MHNGTVTGSTRRFGFISDDYRGGDVLVHPRPSRLPVSAPQRGAEAVYDVEPDPGFQQMRAVNVSIAE